jgi:hypothetical protein
MATELMGDVAHIVVMVQQDEGQGQQHQETGPRKQLDDSAVTEAMGQCWFADTKHLPVQVAKSGNGHR